MTHRTARALMLGLLLLTYPVGCTSRAQKVVATVGTRNITVGEMEETAARVAKDNPTYFGTEPDSLARRRLLDDLINKDLLALEAEARGLATVDSVARQIKAVTSSTILQQLYKDQVTAKAKISDADLRRAYNRLQESLVVKHILVGTEDSARMVVTRLKQGASFDSLARSLSRDPGSAATGGLLPGFSAGDMVQEFEDAAYGMKPGQTSGPVKSPFGWHVLRLVERGKRAHVQPFEEIRDQMRTALEKRAEQHRLAEFLDELRAKHKVAWTTDGLTRVDAVLAAIRRAEKDTTTTPTLKVGIAFPATGVTTRAESAAVLVRYDKDKTYTVGQALKSLRQVPAFMRPAPGDTARLREFLDGEVLKTLLEEDAEKQGLAKRADVKKEIETKREEVLVTALYRAEIGSAALPGDTEARSYYERHPEMFTAPRRVSFYRITSETKARADSIYALTRKGKRLSAIGKQLGEDPFGSIGTVPEQPVRDDPNDVATRAFGMDVGQVSAPMEFPAGSNAWVIFETVSKKPAGLLKFEEVKADAQRGAAVELQESRLGALLEKLRQKFPVAVHDDVLAQVRLPARSSGGAGPGSSPGGTK